jgi:hypothetical protein
MTEVYLAKLEKKCNIGVALGEVSNGLVTIDLDGDRYVDCLLEANPLLATTLRTRGRRGCNIWLRCNGSYPPSCKLKDASGRKVGEWRADGSQTIVSGRHPDGPPYKFVVEKPVITISYNQIIWPPGCLLPPDATESKRVRGVGEQEVVALVPVEVSAALDGKCIEIQPWLGQKNRIAQIAPTACHQNNASLFKLARLVRSYEKEVGRPATNTELELVFDRWCSLSLPFWRLDHTRDDYYAEFLDAYGYARMGLDENPLEIAISRAAIASLPEVPGFKGEAIRKLAAICRELQTITGANPFFLPTRRLGEILGVHWSTIALWLRNFCTLGIIYLAPGEVRKRGGGRSPRYHYGGCRCCYTSLENSYNAGPLTRARVGQESGVLSAETRGTS